MGWILMLWVACNPPYPPDEFLEDYATTACDWADECALLEDYEMTHDQCVGALVAEPMGECEELSTREAEACLDAVQAAGCEESLDSIEACASISECVPE
jgi:hypothetical protein